MKEIISYLKKEWFLLVVFIPLISFSQALILKPHLEFGFSPDDVRIMSDYSSLGDKPFSQFILAWEKWGGPHFVNPIYYGGLLFSFFGFNYEAYQIIALIFKIISTIFVYLLIQTVFKNKLLSFITGLIYSFHYGSVGSMEMVARTQDYLVITGLNIFLILFYLINENKLRHFFWLIIASLILFSSFFINPIRAYPILPFICFLALLLFLRKKSLLNFFSITKQLTIFFFPLFIVFGLLGTEGASYGNMLQILEKIKAENFQMLLAPFSTFGSLFLTGDILKPLSFPAWTIKTFISNFLGKPLLIFGITTVVFSCIFSQKPWRFFLGVFISNLLLELLIFFAIDHGANLPLSSRMSYDPYTFATSAILGGYIIILTIFVFFEWLQNRQNIYLKLYLFGISFAVTFIWFTWIVYSVVHIPMGIYGYSTIPSMGVSVAIASILTLAYNKITQNTGLLKPFAPLVFSILIPYFFFSNNQIQQYFKYNIGYGNKASDQSFLKDKFWSFLKNDNTPCNNFFFFQTTPNELNGLNYSFIMLDRFDRWYSLYGPYQSKTPCPVAILVNNEDTLLSSYSTQEGKEGFLYKYFDERGDLFSLQNFFPLEDFYAFKLQNRDIVDIKAEILERLRAPFR